MPKNQLKPKAAAVLAAAPDINLPMQTENATNYREQMASLLKDCGLPYEDLPADAGNFLVILENGELVGCAGIEPYGRYGLLRSVAVTPLHRNRGLAGILIEAAEHLATEKGISEIYLLTETVPAYFAGKGYEKIERAAVVGEIQQSSEFAHVCPQTALVMKKILR